MKVTEEQIIHKHDDSEAKCRAPIFLDLDWEERV